MNNNNNNNKVRNNEAFFMYKSNGKFVIFREIVFAQIVLFQKHIAFIPWIPENSMHTYIATICKLKQLKQHN